MSYRKTREDYIELSDSVEYTWLGDMPARVDEKSLWRCPKGHEWMVSYTNIRTGRGCPYCANRVPKQPHDYVDLANSRGFSWIGEFPKDTHHKTAWQCLEEHEWGASYNSILKGSGCPHCYGNAPKTNADYYELADSVGWTWLGSEAITVNEKSLWRCENGHEWETTFSRVQAGVGCPHCAGLAPKTPEDYHIAASNAGFLWIGPEVQNTSIKTWWQCSEGHQWEATYHNIVHGGNGCPHCARQFPKTPKDYHFLASSRGYFWLGPEVKNTFVNTRWRCFLGHEWEARYNTIQQGKGCPVCAANMRAQQKRHIYEDYFLLGRKRGFSWLGNLPQNAFTPTLWVCSEGHQWEASYVNIYAGNGCPHCADMVNGKTVSSQQRALSELLHGQLNHPIDGYHVDIFLSIEGQEIIVAYDSWFWHADKLDKDEEKYRKLLQNGHRILRIKSNKLLPTEGQLNKAFDQLLNGTTYVEITLEDWGNGDTWADKYKGGSKD